MLKVSDLKDGIQRKAHKNKPLSDCQQKPHRRIAKRRAKIEHVLAGIRHMGGKHLRSIGMTRAAVVMMAACYNLKRLASFLHWGVDAFCKAKPSKTLLRLQKVKSVAKQGPKALFCYDQHAIFKPKLCLTLKSAGEVCDQTFLRKNFA